LDLQFLELVKDVPGAIAKIYANFYPGQAGPSPKALAAFEEYLDANKREKRGNQRRSLEDFHLTKEDVAYSEYCEMFL
jgi:hypothetical protein